MRISDWSSDVCSSDLLGLLMTPKDMQPYLVGSGVAAAVLILLARPAAVALCLLPFRYTWREIGFISWIGLRGAVPIFLATIPVLANLPHSEVYVTAAFICVVASLTLQGWTIEIGRAHV